MFSFSRSSRLAAVAGLIFVLGFSAFADTLRLKDGSIIKGRIISFGSGRFIIVVGDGSRQRQMTFDAAEVESIEFDSSASPSAATVAGRQPQQVKDSDPQFIETSTPPKSVPRVVTSDPIRPTTQAQVPANREPAPTAPAQSPSRIGQKPVEVSVKVLADNTANGWTNSGWVVKKGQTIRIIGDGSVSLGKNKTTGPSGLYDVEDTGKLLKSVPTGALIAVIGDDNNEFIYIGSERTFTATRDGALFLGLNEGNLNDNSGTFDVRIEILPA